MKKSPINFDGATHEYAGCCYTRDDSGKPVNIVHFQKVTLADGTVFKKEYPAFIWRKMIPNKDRQHFYERDVFWRKCNDRYAFLLDQFWKENPIPEPETPE